MPVENKRNAVSRKQYNPTTSEDMYSNSYPDEDNLGTSPPALCIPPPPPFRPLSPPSDPEPDIVPEAMTYSPDPPHDLLLHTGAAESAEEGSPLSTLKPLPPSKLPQRVSVETQVQVEDVENSTSPRRGHVRSPVLAREPSTLESFSRTIRGYVPSSIAIPSASPSPPRVSRPVSFGSFLTPSRMNLPSSPHSRGFPPPGRHARRRSSDLYSAQEYPSPEWRAQFTEDEVNSAVFNLDEDSTSGAQHAKYPSSEQSEDIVWSRWSNLPSRDGTKQRLVLIIGYLNGLQIWDCSDLGSISEVINLSGRQWSGISVVQYLPAPRATGDPDSFEHQRPLLGMLRSTSDIQELLVYSLRTHQVIRNIQISSLVSFAAGSEFLALSSARPSALHVLSSRTFNSLYTIPPSHILPFAYTPITPDSSTFVIPGTLDNDTTTPHHSSAVPQPIFTLSNRLLAFASIPTASDTADQTSSRTPHATTAQDVHQDSILKLPISQADLSSAAVKLGGSVLSGMKVLGGMAFTAARAGVSAAMSTDSTRVANPNHSPPAPGKFFSRSAPAASGALDAGIAIRPGDETPASSLPSNTDVQTPPRDGYTITVLDLQALANGATTPRVVAEFVAGRDRPVSRIAFSSDGTSLAVAFKDGQTMKVFKLRPSPPSVHVSRESSNRRVSYGSTISDSKNALHPPAHVYDLKRGRTVGIVESLDWAYDERWIAVGTRKRTVHIFATNPYGGPSDDNSHLEGRVINIGEPQPLSTELDPFVRLRALKPRRPDQPPLPLAFTFISHSRLSSTQPKTISASSSPSSSRSVSASPTKASDRIGQDQDVLIFDPHHGVLSLHRLTPSRRLQDHVVSSSRGTPSTSFPGVSTIHRLTSSTSADSGRQPSALTRMMGGPSHLSCHEVLVATWILRRSIDWKEIKPTFGAMVDTRSPSVSSKSNWLAQAELSTCSQSKRLIPRSIYHAHQFSFFYIGEDYHALLRSHRLDVPATKIDVRRQVEVSASGAHTGESFVSGSSLPSHAGFPSSFDEPLASALAAELRNNPSPPIIPMYPNGPVSRSLRPGIPIRNVAVGISDGMSEGLGRLRREIGKVRSPKLLPRGDGVPASVPLEFDEEDEDFSSLDALPSAQGGRQSRAMSHEAASVSTPSTGTEPLPVEQEQEPDLSWENWENEDKQAVDDLEQFDDIGVGYMDEEWPHATVRSRPQTRS